MPGRIEVSGKKQTGKTINSGKDVLGWIAVEQQQKIY